VLAQAAPARTRAHCRPTSLDRLHECKPLREVLPPPRSRAAAAAQRQHSRPNLYACASAGPAGCAACTACCNTVQHAATQRNVCALHQRRSRVPQDARPVRCVRHGKAKARRRSRTGAACQRLYRTIEAAAGGWV
jgi:hypothetical protein